VPSSSHSPGGTGQLFPDATLPTRDGGTIALDTFRPKWDLVMVMLGADGVPPEIARLLDALAAARADVESEDGKVLTVSASAEHIEHWRWPFPLLLDAGGLVHRRSGAMDAAGRPAPALFTTDHYREIYGAMRPGKGTWPTSAKDVIDWLVFANIQCPECNAPESDW
jgi:peroxiredoxin